MELNAGRLRARVERARIAVGRGTRYVLGKGGFKPSSPQPGDLNGSGVRLCDCTGFGSWWLGISRYQGDKHKPWSSAIPWVETTAIFKDATGRRLLFTTIKTPVPGCGLVYPDKYLGRVKLREGHFMAVTRVEDGKVYGVDCSPSNSRRVGDAIAERELTWALKRGAVPVALVEDFNP